MEVSADQRAFGEDSAPIVLDLIRELVAELDPEQGRHSRVGLDSRLDRDLGLDSLARVELLGRVERALGLELPNEALAEVETAADLLAAARRAPAVGPPARHDRPPLELHPSEALPEQACSLVDVLRWHVDAHPERPHVVLPGETDEQPLTISYAGLYERAARQAAGLVRHGVQSRQQVAIMLPTCEDYLSTFFAALLIGAVPVPIYPPVRLSQIRDHLERQVGILESAEAVLLVTVPEALAVARLLRARVPTLRAVVTPAELVSDEPARVTPRIEPDDVAFLQYTSGSTGRPKGVVLTHANLLANIRAMGQAAEVTPHDVIVTWLPLYHDLGLIGGWLSSLYFGLPAVLMSPLAFLARPDRWLWAIDRYRGTISAAPNFAYELCVRRVAEERIEGLDLSSWRIAGNGAEPVSAQTVDRFCARFAAHRFRREAMYPVYGLAESSVGLAFPVPGRGPIVDRIERERFVRSGRAVPAEPATPGALRFVACGRPLPGHQIRVVDAAGREVPERQEGRLEFHGPSCTRGYFRNPEATRRLFDGAWLDSGDLAYVAGGDLYLTGRVKDVIIRAGRNVYPEELEEAVADVPGVRRGCVAVFGSPDPDSGTERLIVLAETRRSESDARQALRAEITAVATDVLGTPPDEVVLAPPHTVLKTSSGKIRRAASRELYERGGIGKTPPGWVQLLRLSLASLGPRLARARRDVLEVLFAGWAWLAFSLVVAVSWPLVMLLPNPRSRWKLARGTARLLARATGTPLRIEGIERLPRDGRFLLVCNHQSILDGFALVATLPIEVAIVAKSELAAHFWTRAPLDRIGVQYVDRFDPARGVAGTRRIAEAADIGRTLLFFPEGTDTRMPGLLPFHLGAFSVAASVGVVVVPVVISGTRSILRPTSWFPRRGAIAITVGSPIEPSGHDFDAALELRRRARTWMLQRSAEPDLRAAP